MNPERNLKELELEVKELRLRNEELQLHAVLIDRILECAAEGMAVCQAIAEEPYVRFTVWNERMTQITGYTMEYINQHGWYQTVYPDLETSKRARERMQSMRVGDDLISEEWTITRADGKEAILDISTCLLPGEDDTVHVMALMNDVTDVKLAIRDELTELLNRRGFNVLAEQQVKIASRNNLHMALIFADLDGLKEINDLYGHEEGDRALRDTAELLKKVFRKSDIIGRIGGDEFAILMTTLSKEVQQDNIFRNILEHLKAFNENGGRKYQLSMSLGLSRFDPKNPQPVENLLREADSYMYQQKKKTRVLRSSPAPPP